MNRTELLQMAKPILFNTNMVWAILDGRKTVTRRVIKPQPHGYFEVNEEPLYIYDMDFQQGRIISPYQTGDILYVRETWCNANKDDVEPDYYYFADTIYCEDYNSDEWKWRPSIHMPKDAARIFLKVKAVRVERLQEITEDGTIKEGIYPSNCRDCNVPFGCDTCPDEGYDEIDEFVELWNSTIKKSDLDRYGWDASPWVWVIEFVRIEEGGANEF